MTHTWENVDIGLFIFHQNKNINFPFIEKKQRDVSKNRGGPPKWMVKIMENPIKMGWFGGTPIFGNTPYLGPFVAAVQPPPHGPRWGSHAPPDAAPWPQAQWPSQTTGAASLLGKPGKRPPGLEATPTTRKSFWISRETKTRIPNFFRGLTFVRVIFWIVQKMLLSFFRGFLFSCLFSAEKIGVQSVHCQFPQFWMEKLWLFLADEFMMYTWFPFQISRNTSCVALHHCLIGKPTSSSFSSPSSQSNKKKLEIPSQNKKYHGHPWTMNVQKSRAKNVSEVLKILFYKPSPFHPTSFCWSLWFQVRTGGSRQAHEPEQGASRIDPQKRRTVFKRLNRLFFSLQDSVVKGNIYMIYVIQPIVGDSGWSFVIPTLTRDINSLRLMQILEGTLR